MRRPRLYRLRMPVMRAFSAMTSFVLLASRIVCLIVIAWFVVFAVDQSGKASTHQVNELTQEASQPAASTPAKQSGAKHVLNEAGKALTSPFSGLTSKSSSAWLAHGVDTLLALLVYGAGIGFVIRLVRVRV